MVATFILGRPEGATALPGLLLGSLTYYVRSIGLGFGTLLVMVNWYQPEPEERGEYMAMILCSLVGCRMVPSANNRVVRFVELGLGSGAS